MYRTSLLFALVLAAQPALTAPLNVKPGLWETTTTTMRKGAKLPTNLDTLKPEQRKKVEAMLAARDKQESKTVKACLTQAQIDNGEAFMGKSHHANCTRTPETSSATVFKARIECTGANRMVGTIEMRTVDPEHMEGTTELTYGTSDRQQLLTSSTIGARWLQADCPQAPAAAHAASP